MYNVLKNKLPVALCKNIISTQAYLVFTAFAFNPFPPDPKSKRIKLCSDFTCDQHVFNASHFPLSGKALLQPSSVSEATAICPYYCFTEHGHFLPLLRLSALDAFISLCHACLLLMHLPSIIYCLHNGTKEYLLLSIKGTSLHHCRQISLENRHMRHALSGVHSQWRRWVKHRRDTEKSCLLLFFSCTTAAHLRHTSAFGTGFTSDTLSDATLPIFKRPFSRPAM